MKNNINAGWIFPIVIISVLIGYLSTQAKYFDFDYTINLIDLFSLLSTIYVGIYIAKKIQKTLESSRVEKDLIIELFKSSIQKSKYISEQIESNNIEFNTIKKDLKVLSTLLSDLKDYQDICDFKSDSENIKKIFLKLKKIITNNSPVNGFITLPLESQRTAKTTIKNLISSLMISLIETNRN